MLAHHRLSHLTKRELLYFVQILDFKKECFIAKKWKMQQKEDVVPFHVAPIRDFPVSFETERENERERTRERERARGTK